MPFILPGQAQKELFHNEALQVLDIVVAAAAEEAPGNDPPLSPTSGSSYLVGDSALRRVGAVSWSSGGLH